LDDAEAIFETVNTLECQMNMPEFYSAFHHKERITHFIQVFSDYWRLGNGMLWSIKTPSGVAGFVGVMDIPDMATLFYATHPAHRNKGYMKECVMCCLEYFRKQYAGTSSIVLCSMDNIPSSENTVKYVSQNRFKTKEQSI
jgi:RimJ/RimL family protein N-acetyltransferase